MKLPDVTTVCGKRGKKACIGLLILQADREMWLLCMIFIYILRFAYSLRLHYIVFVFFWLFTSHNGVAATVLCVRVLAWEI